MFVEKYTIQNFGSKWTNKGKEKKNQLLENMTGENISLKKLNQFVSDFDDAINTHEHKHLEITIKFLDAK